MQDNQKLKSTPILIKLGKWTAVAVVIYTFAGFLLLPPVIKSIMSKKLSKQLDREVVIRDINLNPFALSINVKDFVIKGRDKPETFFSFSELYTNLQIVSIFKKGLILKEIRVVDPYINIIRGKDELYNFSDLLNEDKAEPASESGPLRYSLNNIQILNGSIDFKDSPKDTMHKTRNIVLAVPMISNLPYHMDTHVQPVFKATVNGAPFHLEGRTKPFSDSFETVLELDIKV